MMSANESNSTHRNMNHFVCPHMKLEGNSVFNKALHYLTQKLDLARFFLYNWEILDLKLDHDSVSFFVSIV